MGVKNCSERPRIIRFYAPHDDAIDDNAYAPVSAAHRQCIHVKKWIEEQDARGKKYNIDVMVVIVPSLYSDFVKNETGDYEPKSKYISNGVWVLNQIGEEKCKTFFLKAECSLYDRLMESEETGEVNECRSFIIDSLKVLKCFLNLAHTRDGEAMYKS